LQAVAIACRKSLATTIFFGCNNLLPTQAKHAKRQCCRIGLYRILAGLVGKLEENTAMRHDIKTYNVRDLQNISHMCLACGEENIFGLHAQFMNLDDGSLAASFTTIDEHQSYPGRVHGGIIAAILDELLGRVVQVSHPEIFGVTMELNIKYRAPVPLGEQLLCIGHLDKLTSRCSEAAGVVLLPDGKVAAEGFARYLRAPLDQIVSEGLAEKDWHPDLRPHPDTITA
jgi:uncharacterized protein (TIGR00369 family)